MVKFNIRPAELQTMIGKLGQFQNSMNNLSNQMRSTAQSLGSTWKDPQYHAFIASIDGMSKTMKGSAQAMESMRKNLTTLKRNLERSEQEYKKLNP
ncbi:WXG100 family type VII secretion target [Candidatus Levibacter sp. Uisw_134_01]|jgi:WXG100 family type VII secretion target|uniref:WXG100 family type VII secretion target n=1 Tax=Candidatus Levibacter sp. Uisw_134_01 TaxID=3230999 RepID=UPI00236FBCAF|nr:WXG100 family type VII secretion target [Alphaproteobacteria bacterium]